MLYICRFGRDPYRGDGPPPVSPRGPGYGPGGPMNSPGLNQQGSVMMAYGLNHEKMNCERLFNILCLYGNVSRVSLLPLHFLFYFNIFILLRLPLVPVIFSVQYLKQFFVLDALVLFFLFDRLSF